ncbi:digalactosyldiacylglycerol synthase chloroplastic, partial [Raphidocelis subcapitata]
MWPFLGAPAPSAPAAPAPGPAAAGFHGLSLAAVGVLLFAHTAGTFVAGLAVGGALARRRARAGAPPRRSGSGASGGKSVPASREASAHGRRFERGALSSLRQPGRSVAVVTTAALPWRTGTSVNPLLRAAHLATDPNRKVFLVVPWLEEEEQRAIFPAGLTFPTREAHADYIIGEARERTHLPCDFKVLFYDGKYFTGLGSILPVGDVTAAVPAAAADVAILEEPEHLNWCQHKSRWTDKFNHVVGIMHTNYLAYVADGPGSATMNVAALRRVNKWVCRIHCHKVIKLSDAVQRLPRQVTCNVHGVGSNFLSIGRARREAAAEEYGGRRFSKGAYFIGKAVWGKGYKELIDLMAAHQAARSAAAEADVDAASAAEGLSAAEAAAIARAHSGGGRAPPSECHLDVYGSGEDLGAIKAAAAARGLDFSFFGGRDHADASMHEYRVFVNPSTSDVVATTTAEALAMGKWVVVEDIACNEFFKQ